jgi:hypothetical protein
MASLSASFGAAHPDAEMTMMLRRHAGLLRPFLLVLVAALPLAACQGTGGSMSGPTPGATPLQLAAPPRLESGAYVAATGEICRPVAAPALAGALSCRSSDGRSRTVRDIVRDSLALN